MGSEFIRARVPFGVDVADAVLQDAALAAAAASASWSKPKPTLAAGVRVAGAATVIGAWEVDLANGRYVLEVDEHPGPEVLRARVAGGGTIELHHGRVRLTVDAPCVEALVEHGVGFAFQSD